MDDEKSIQHSKQKGGARKGAGRKPKDPTEIITFRVPSDKSKEIKPLVAAYIKTLINPNDNQATQMSQPAPIEIIQTPKPKAPATKPKSAEPTMAELFRQMNKK